MLSRARPAPLPAPATRHFFGLPLWLQYVPEEFMKRLAIVLVATLVAGCSWFGMGSNTGSAPQLPADAVAYQCDQGKRLVVRYPTGAKYVMVMLPDREFRLDQTVSGSGIRYSNGRTTLQSKGDEAFLEEGTTTTFANCKQVAK